MSSTVRQGLSPSVRLITRRGVLAIQDLLGGEHEFLTDGGYWIPGNVKPAGLARVDEVVLSRSKV